MNLLHIKIDDADKNGRFPIHILNSPSGSKTRKPVRQPFNWHTLDIDLTLYNQLMIKGDKARQIGIALAQFLLPPRIKGYVNDALKQTQANGVPLHIRLEIAPRTLQSVPWELLYDKTRGVYYANGQTSTLTRYTPPTQAIRPLPTPTPLRILLAVANPSDLVQFDVELTISRIRRTLKPLGDDLELIVLPNATPAALHDALMQHDPHVLHLICHGNRNGLALVNEETGKTQLFDREQMRALLDGRAVRVVILAACDSAKVVYSPAASAEMPYLNMAESGLQAGVPAVIGMQIPLPVRAAQRFNRAIYRALVAGRPLDQAVGEARVRLFTSNDDKLHWSIPVLHLGTPDGVIWRTPQFTIPALTEKLRPYLELLVRRNGRLPLGAIDPAGRESNHITLGQVFISLDADVSVQVERPSGRPVIVRQTQAVGHAYTNRQLILLGDPGSGKSTLLRYMATCFAQAILHQSEQWLDALGWTEDYLETQDDLLQDMLSMLTRENLDFQQVRATWRGTVPIPIFIELRNFARTMPAAPDPLALWTYAKSQLEAVGLGESVAVVETAVTQGRAIFLLDGVDEVPMSERKAVWQAIGAMEQGALGGNRWIATCRILSYTAHEAPSGIASRTLQTLNSDQISRFVTGWYAALYQAGQLNQAQADAMTHHLHTALHRPQLQTLAENPMLLTIMALVQTYHGTLPEGRAKLYQMCVETLLLRWQRHKEDDSGSELPNVLAQLDITQQDLERLLWEIAWTAHYEAEDRETAADIPESELMSIAKDYLGSFAKAEQFLAYTEERAHLLISRGGRRKRVYTFPHRTFEEYLAACYLASQRRFPHMALQLAKEKETWREVLNLAAGTLAYNQNNFETVIDAVKEMLPRTVPSPNSRYGWHRIWLAAEMMVTVGKQAAEKDEIGQEVMPKLRQQLVALIEANALTPRQRAEAAVSLGHLGDPRAGVLDMLPEMLPVSDFALGKYPVTNAQFRFFIEDGGYATERFWDADWWTWKEKEQWTQPRFWDEPLFALENKPVVGVSWYEAVAYCRWLAEKAKRPFRLPTAQEWQQAAAGSKSYLFPWGNEWQLGHANDKAARIGQPSVVGLFPQGAAEFGGLDLAGNVWEWVKDGRLSDIVRVAKGGSWSDEQLYLQTDTEITVFSHLRRDTLGFRVALSLA